MGISSSLFSGVSGLKANGTAMSVIGDNIANSNTTGFKASRTLFSDLLSETVTGSGGASQVGRGTNLSTVDVVFKQGSFENTELSTDLGIEGEGFFIVKNDSDELRYTRAGAFRFDADGNLINPEGLNVQGYLFDEDGNLGGDLVNLAAETKSLSPAKATENINLATNLNAGAKVQNAGVFDVSRPTGTSNYSSSINVFDSLGKSHLMTTYFTKASNNTWSWNSVVSTADLDLATGTGLSAGQNIKAGTALPAAVILPSGTSLPANSSLIAGTTIPAGAGPFTTIPQNTIIPSGTIVPNSTIVPNGTIVPSGTAVPQNTDIPVGTEIPAGTIIATGTTIPNTTTIPSGTTVPANAAIPQNTVIPDGTTIPAGTLISDDLDFSGFTLQQATLFPAGTIFTADVLLPSGATLLAGAGLASDTTFTSGTTLPAGTIPAGEVLEFDAVLNGNYTLATADLLIADDMTLADDMLLAADLQLTGSMTLADNMTVSGVDMNLASDMVLGGDMQLVGAMTLAGNMRLAGDMRISGANMALGGNMTLGGEMRLPSAMTVEASFTLPAGTGVPFDVALTSDVTFASAAKAAAAAAPADNPQAAADAVRSALNGLIANSPYADVASASYDPELLALAQSLANSYAAAAQQAATSNPGDSSAVVTAVSSAPSSLVVGSGTIAFDSNGALVPSANPLETTAGILRWNNGSNQDQQIDLNFNLTQFTSNNIVDSTSQDGYSTGSLVRLNITEDGIIVGNYSNGNPRQIGQVAVAKFTNPGGLQRAGSNMFSSSDISGAPVIGTSSAGIGKVFNYSLEQSNVDLAQEFVKMITTQRGFQANSRIITTTDEMLNELINLKR